MYNAATSMINAFQRGLLERQNEEDRVTAEEDRTLQKDLLKHRLAQMKLEERLAAYRFNTEGARARAQSLTGRPEADLQAVMPKTLPATGIGGVATPSAPPAGSPLQESLGPMMQGPAPPPFAIASVPNTMAPPQPRTVAQPGFVDATAGYNAPAYDLPIYSEEQLLAKQDALTRREAAIKAESATHTVGRGQKLVTGTGKLLAEGGTDPTDVETVRHNKAMEGIAQETNRFNKEFTRVQAVEVQRLAAEEVLKNNLLQIEADAEPDPKALAKYEVERVNDKTASPPSPRYGPEKIAALKLVAVNSYRKKMKLPSLTRLPKDWGGPGEPLASSHAVGQALPTLTSAKRITLAHLEAVARKNGTTVAQETLRAQAEGFTIVR